MNSSSLLLIHLPETKTEQAFWQIRTIEKLLSKTYVTPLWVDAGNCLGEEDNCRGDEPEDFIKRFGAAQGAEGRLSAPQKEVGRLLEAHSPSMVAVFVCSSGQEGAGQAMCAFIRDKDPDIKIIIVADGCPEEEPELTIPGKVDGFIRCGRTGLASLLNEISNVYGVNNLTGKRFSESETFDTALKIFGDLCLVSPWCFNNGGDLAEYLNTTIEKSMVKGVVFLNLQDAGADLPPGRSDKDLIDLLRPWLTQKSKDVMFCIQVQVSREATLSSIEANLSFLFDHGLRMIFWQVIDAELPRQLLWQVSKQGIWNHVSGKDLFGQIRDDAGLAETSDGNGKTLSDQGAWIANNPNIVHSFEDVDRQGRGPLIAKAVQAPEILLTYRKVMPMPTIPFWQILPDPLLIPGFLTRMTQKELVRHRVDPDQLEISVLDSGVSYNFKMPGELPPGVLDEIITMVDAGGSVDITHVRANLEKAYLIGYAVENGVIIGNSSLKHPRQVFIDRLKVITGLDFTNFVERGYTSVRPEYRAMGIGAKLLEGLTVRADDVKVFSIIGEDNLATRKIAIRNNTRKIATYFSDKVGKEMGVWMPASMIDDQWDLLI